MKSKKFECHECEKSFVSQSKLGRHKRETHGVKHWICPVCHRGFARKENYAKHIANLKIHRTCAECGQTNFSSNRDLTDHIRAAHGSQARIDFENRHFRQAKSSKTSTKTFSQAELELLPEEDPPFPSRVILSQFPYEQQNVIQNNWGWIKTKYTRKSVVSTFSFRFQNGSIETEEIAEFLRRIHQIQNQSYKVQISFGYCYRIAVSYADPTESEDISNPMFFIPQKPSSNNPGFLPDGPWTIANVEHMEDLISRLEDSDIMEYLNLRRPSTKYIIDLVTNIMVYVYQMGKPAIGCCQEELPNWLMNKKSVLTLFYQNGRKERWKKPQCIFRCLAAHELLSDEKAPYSLQKLQKGTESMFQHFCYLNSINPKLFDGAVSLMDLPKVEETFQVRIFVYELIPRKESTMCRDTAIENDLVASLLRKPSEQSPDMGEEIFLDLSGNHFSLITNINSYAEVFICGVKDNCRRLFSTRKHCLQHQNICSRKKRRKVRCTGGGYEPVPTLFDELARVGISVREEDRFLDKFCTYDAECITQEIPESKQKHGTGTKHEAELILASLSICSSVDGFREPRFFLSKGDPQLLVNESLDYMLRIQKKSSELQQQRYKPYGKMLQKMVEKETDRKKLKQLNGLKQKLWNWISRLHVFGWNSRGFDLPLLRSMAFKYFSQRHIKVEKIIKNSTAYLLLVTKNLKFLDMQALVSPHASYSAWLKSLEIPGAEKSFFPFLWFDSLEKLQQEYLPDRTYWSNDLKNVPITDDEWKEIVKAWHQEKMKTMADFLKYYNNKDVSHFVDGVEEQQKFWKDQGICMLTEGLSLSGLSLRLFNKFIGPDTYLALPRKEDYNYIRALRKSINGGLAQVYHRLHIAGVTRIRKGPHLCESVQGWDFNSLYLTELGQAVPTGIPFLWEPHSDTAGNVTFIRRPALPACVSVSELEFLSYESWKRQRRIQHYLSSKQQYKIGDSNYRADGFLPPNLAMEFHGCRFHSHQIENPNCPHSPLGSPEEALDRLIYTRDKIEYMKSLGGLQVLEMTSCEWDRIKKSDADVKHYLYSRFYPPGFAHQNRRMSQSEILGYLKTGKIFGLCMVDIYAPKNLIKKFEIMQPLIVNRMVSKEDLGPLMES